MAYWKNGLCGCFDNCTLCLITYFLPCYTLGKNAEAVGESCIACGLMYAIPLVNLASAAYIRGKIRQNGGIDGTACNDVLAVIFCPLCALVQEAQEVRGDGPTFSNMSRE